jgi:hypothetical protein
MFVVEQAEVMRFVAEKPRSNEFIRYYAVTNKFVTTWRAFISSGRRA